MHKKTTTVACALLVKCAAAYLLCSGAAHAFGIFIVAPSTPISVGSEFDLQVWADFSQDPTLGGGFDIVYDDDALDFLSWTPEPIGDPAFSRLPDVFPGFLEGIAFGDFNGFTGPAQVGTLRFELVAPPMQSLLVELQETNSIAGPFLSVDTFTPQDVNYGGFGLPPAAIPVPAGLPLLYSAIGLLAALRLRQPAAG
ncbi:MAG: hypothetical protein AAFN78_05840 [Pseudomonadota bacterium]